MADVLILGQGLAGTLLAWEFERSGINFVIADPGHASAASAAAAGIINPITGRRLVKSWRVDELLPAARAAYQEMERAFGVRLWRDVRVLRRFVDERERTVFVQKRASGELAPYAGDEERDGFWIVGGGRVDLNRLLEQARLHWQRTNRLQATAWTIEEALAQFPFVIDCTGIAATRTDRFALPWEFSKGEILEVSAPTLEPDVVINARHWILPIDNGRALVGATHEAGVVDRNPTAAARHVLLASARRLTGGDVEAVGQRAGVRVYLPDKRPVAGRHPTEPRLGLINALGAKGALWAPFLAREWVRHLRDGAGFDADIAVLRGGG